MLTKYLPFILFLLTTSLQAQQTVGLFLNDSLAYNGYTLVASNSAKSTYLIDNCGRVVNTWTSDYIPYFSAYLTPEGNLLRTARLGALGAATEMYDWDGNLIWTYNFSGDGFSQHHDIELLPNGNILVLAWESFDVQSVIEAGRNADLVNEELRPEFIVELQPIGADSARIVWEWHVFDHLVQDHDPMKSNYGKPADHPELIDFNYIGIGGFYEDWLHANHINYNPQLDQIIISVRNFNELWVIDHSTTTEEAAGHTGGKYGKGGDLLYRWGNPITYRRGTDADKIFYDQHNAHWIPEGYPGEGNIMVFNNGRGRMPVEFSSVDVIVPPVDAMGNYTLPSSDLPYLPSDLLSSYTATPPSSMLSLRISSAQRLPNGNTLICVGQTGRLFEIDEMGNVHWDYITPLRGNNPVTQGDIASGNTVFSALRYSTNFEGFVGKDLTPGAPIELDPLPSDCEITTDIHTAFAEYGITAYPNPANDQIRIMYDLNGKAIPTQLELYDYQGRFLLKKDLPTGSDETIIKCSDLPSGIYFYLLRTSTQMSEAKKFVIYH